MNYKSFEYRHKDISLLNRDSSTRTMFVILFSAIFLWQIFSLRSALLDGSFGTIEFASTCAVVFICFVFVLISIIYTVKNNRTINVIKAKGKCVRSVDILFDSKKDGFMSMFSILTKFISLISLIVLTCSVTFCVLQATFFEKISFFLPLLVTLCLCGFYSCYHVKGEIKTAKTVDEFNKIYQ